jgi:glucosyl-3-phosphoglycerate synthase
MQSGPRDFGRGPFAVDQLRAAKGGRVVTVCIPARDEAATVGAVVAAVADAHGNGPGGSGLVDEVLVVDDGSRDETAEFARSAGARVVAARGPGGKGQAMRTGVDESRGEFVVFLDADIENTGDVGNHFITGLLGPLLLDRDIVLVKGYYERPIGGAPSGGGRVTELMARPLIEVLFPELSAIRQPLSGETAAHRWVFDKVGFAPGYGVELGLLVDVARRFGAPALGQVDLGVRVHRNRPLDELRPQATEILRAALDRVDPRPG